MAGKFECNEAGARSVAADVDAGDLVSASEKLRQCLNPGFATYTSDILKFAAQVKQFDKVGVGFDTTLHIHQSTDGTKNTNMQAELEFR